MQRALSIYFPRWPVLLAMRRHLRSSVSDAGRKPARNACFLLVATARGKQVIHDCCANASRAGVRSGITLAHARALVHQSQVIEAEHQPSDDEKKLSVLARWSLRFAPTVAPDPPDGLFLDIAGCADLFGGEVQHIAAIDAALRRIGLPARLAVAPTYGSAWAMARFGERRVSAITDHQIRESLRELPVESLRVDSDVRAALSEVDIRFIGELFNIPQSDLAARYGSNLLDRLHQATGDVCEFIEPLKTVEPLSVTHTFDGPIRQATVIESVSKNLLASLIERMTRRGQGAYELLITFWRVDAGPVRESFRFTQATREIKHIWSMMEGRLHSLRLGHGVEEITLDATRTDDMRNEQIAIWGRDDDGEADAEAMGRLIDRLVDRLGDEAITAIEPVESHVPERAYEPVPPLSKTSAPVMLPYGVRRPSYLLKQPEPARVIALFPNGPPSWMQWNGDGLDIVAADGPERIALPWWNRNASAARDYFIVRDKRGRCIWIFRARDSLADGQWFVHGIWA